MSISIEGIAAETSIVSRLLGSPAIKNLSIKVTHTHPTNPNLEQMEKPELETLYQKVLTDISNLYSEREGFKIKGVLKALGDTRASLLLNQLSGEIRADKTLAFQIERKLGIKSEDSPLKDYPL